MNKEVIKSPSSMQTAPTNYIQVQTDFGPVFPNTGAQRMWGISGGTIGKFGAKGITINMPI